MTAIIFALVVGLFLSFLVYWYIKFKYLLPVEKKIDFIDKTYARFQDFSREIVKQGYIPQTLEQFNELINHSLIKFHGFFAGTSIMVFDNERGDWLLSYSILEGRLNLGDKTSFLSGVFNKCVNENDLMFIGGFGRQMGTELFNAAALFPFVSKDEKVKKVVFIGIKEETDFSVLMPYLRHLILHINSFYKLYEKIISIKDENIRLKSEVDVMVKELDVAGSRLIKKAKERKALYEIVSRVTDENDVRNGLSAILNIVAKITESDSVGCLFYDENSKSLVLNPQVYGVKLDENARYSISLDNRSSASVKTFLEKKPFITGRASAEKNALKEYVEIFEAESLMIAPIFLHNNMIGVIEAGSKKKDFFTAEHLEFLNIIADELAVIMSVINLYDRLSQTADELAQMNRIKDDFLSTVSHELKTPLTTIKGFISVLLSGEVGSLTDQQVSFLNIVDQAANRLANLISNLLDISRLNGKVEMEFSPCDIREIARNSVSNLMLRAKEKGSVMSFNSDKDIPYVFGDSHWLAQVIDNLIINAIKYSQEKSKVEVRVLDRGDVVTVCVCDDGPGIDKEEQKLVFEKFYRGKNSILSNQGTGLGLAISKSIVEKHGGKIWLESEGEKGSKFYFALPKMKNKE